MMKTFKGYITEAARGKSRLFLGAMFEGKIILSNKFAERLDLKLKNIQAWHITSDYGYEKLLKIQGKQKHISASLSTNERVVNAGIATSGGVLVSLTGDLLYYQPQDVFTDQLPGGRRAVEIPNSYSHDDNSRKQQTMLLNEILLDPKKRHNKLLMEAVNEAPMILRQINDSEKYTKVEDFLKDFFSVDFASIRDIHDLRDGGVSVLYDILQDIRRDSTKGKNVQSYKQQIIKEYIERSEQNVKSSPDILDTLTPGEASKDLDSEYDELVLTNFKVEEVYVTDDTLMIPQEFLDKYEPKTITQSEIESKSREHVKIYEQAREELKKKIKKG